MKKCSRILLHLIFFFSVLTFAHAQITFEKFFDDPSFYPELVWRTTQTFDSGYVVLSQELVASRFVANVLRLDAHGDLLWNRIIELPADITVHLGAPDPVLLTPDSGYVFVSCAAPNGAYTKRTCVVKMNEAGNIEWSTFLTTDSSTLGTYESFFPFNGLNNSIGILGSYRPLAVSEMISILLDENGSVQSAKTFFLPYAHYFHTAIAAHDGIIFCVKRTSGTSFLIGKMNLAGDVQWCKMLSSAAELYIASICEWADHSIAVVGVNNSPVPRRSFLLHLDSVGHSITSKEFGNDQFADLNFFSSAIDASGVLAATGTASYSFTHENMMLVRFDENSNILDSHVYPHAVGKIGCGVHNAHDGFIFCGGGAYFPVDTGGVYMIKTDGEGHNGCDSSVSISFLGDLLITDSVFNLPFANLIINDTSLAITGSMIFNETVLCEDIPDVTHFDEWNNDGLMKVYPTLCSRSLTIEGDGNVRGTGDLELFDLSGRKLMTAKLTGNETTLNMEELHSGFYLLKISQGDRSIQLVKLFKK